MAKRKKNNYIDKEKFYIEMKKRKLDIEEAEKNEKPIPKISDYIGLCFYELATNIAKKPKFAGYPYLDDMISDGILNCVEVVDKFDIERSSKNPFSYFTQVIWYAFYRRITKEKGQTYIQYKLIMENAPDILKDNPDFQEVVEAEMKVYEILKDKKLEQSKKKKVKSEDSNIG
jgi:DNA-directed RNA polymerase specialized sigma subunit